jgi:hypothetical protein
VARRRRKDEALFYIQIHRKHFSTAQTVSRPTIDMVRHRGRRRKGKPAIDRMRLMFPRAMEVVDGTFEVRRHTQRVPADDCIPSLMLAGPPRLSMSMKVRVGGKIFSLTMTQEGF